MKPDVALFVGCEQFWDCIAKERHAGSAAHAAAATFVHASSVCAGAHWPCASWSEEQSQWVAPWQWRSPGSLTQLSGVTSKPEGGAGHQGAALSTAPAIVKKATTIGLLRRRQSHERAFSSVPLYPTQVRSNSSTHALFM